MTKPPERPDDSTRPAANAQDSDEAALDALPPPPTTLGLSRTGMPLRHALPTVPGFEVLGELGRGGLGRVFKAVQLDLGRIVAVKMLHLAELADPDQRDRFLREAQALASLQHPHIVQIFQVCEDRNRLFLVMEYAEGGALDKRLNGRPLPAGLAADILETLARTVEHFHQRGLLHRDLKLANVLLAGPADRPLAAEDVKIADFGLAKPWREGRPDASHPNTIAGTPNYMAPEQAAGRAVSPATDVYALGAVLYELVTGRPPFTGPTWKDTVSQVLGRDPVPPRRLVAGLPPDLETICLKCLAKGPERRYRSAADLADDLHRFRTGRPIRARATGWAERGWKWARRNPIPATLLAALAAVTSVGTGLVTWKWLEALRANQQAETNHRNELNALADLAEQRVADEVLRRQAEDVRRRDYAALVTRAGEAWRSGDARRCQELLNQCPPDLRGWEHDFLRERLQAGQTIIRADRYAVYHVAFHPNGTMLASGGSQIRDVAQTSKIHLWDPATGQERFSLTGHKGPVQWLAFHPTRPWLVSTSLRLDWGRLETGDGSAASEGDGECIVWDLEARQPLLTVPHVHGAAALSRDGRLFAANGADRRVHVWELQAQLPWKEVCRLPDYPGLVKQLAFSPDGTLLVRSVLRIAKLENGQLPRMSELKLWRVADGAEEQALPAGGEEVSAATFAPDGAVLAYSTGSQNTVVLWDVKARRPLRTLFGHTSKVIGLAFDADGAVLASASQDHTVRLWDAASGQERHTLRGHDAAVETVAFAPATSTLPRRLASGDSDGTVRLWNSVSGQDPLTIAGHSLVVTQVAYSPDGQALATRGAGGPVKIWDAVTGRLRWDLEAHAERFAWSPDGRFLLTGGGDFRDPSRPGELIVWDATTGQRRSTLAGHTRYATAVAWHPDGSMFVSVSGNVRVSPAEPGELIFWEAGTGQPKATFRPPVGCIMDLAYHPSGSVLALGSTDGNVYLLDPATGQVRRELTGHQHPVTRVAYSRDGRWLVSGDTAGTVRVWNTTTATTEKVLRAATAAVSALYVRPDGTRLAVAGYDPEERYPGQVRLWDLTSGEEVFRLPGQAAAAFSPDGRRLAVASAGSVAQPSRVQIWDAPPTRELVHFHPGGIVVFGVAFSPDGHQLAVVNVTPKDHGTVTLFDSETRRELGTLTLPSAYITKVAFFPDGRRIATAHQDGTAAVWDAERRQVLVPLKAHGDWIVRIACSPDGLTLATGSHDRFVKLWDAATGAPRAAWEAHGGKRVFDLAYSPDGQRLATAGGDAAVRVWDVTSGREVRHLDGLPGNPVCVAWRPGREQFAAGLTAFGVAIGDARTGERIRLLTGHTGPVRDVVFSRDGRFLFSGSDDRTIRVWDAETGEPLAVLTGHFDMVRSLAVHPQKPWLSSGSYDQSVRVWDIDHLLP